MYQLNITSLRNACGLRDGLKYVRAFRGQALVMEMYNYGLQAKLYVTKGYNVRSIYSNFVYTVLSRS